MISLQKMGGIAALIEAALYVLGIIYFFFVLDYAAVSDPLQKIVLLIKNQAGLSIVTLLIYVVFGIFLVILTLALYQRLKAGSPVLVQTATAFGIIWAVLVIASGMIFNIGMENVIALYAQDPAQATTVWLAIDSVHQGIGGGNEIMGGLWVLLLSWAALRTGKLSKILNSIGLLVGVAGVISAVPSLGAVSGAVFGLGQIVWFVWLGMLMLKNNQS